MRIIEEDNHERVCRCRTCKTKIAYKMQEVKRGYDENRITCPVCREWVSVSIFDRKVKEYGNSE